MLPNCRTFSIAIFVPLFWGPFAARAEPARAMQSANNPIAFFIFVSSGANVLRTLPWAPMVCMDERQARKTTGPRTERNNGTEEQQPVVFRGNMKSPTLFSRAGLMP